MRPLEWLPVLGVTLYLSNLMLGLGLQLRLWRLDRAKWIHHLLYFLVFVSAAAVTYALLRAGGRWWGLLPTLACLFALPRAKGGTRWHMLLTVTGLLGYVLALA